MMDENLNDGNDDNIGHVATLLVSGIDASS